VKEAAICGNRSERVSPGRWLALVFQFPHFDRWKFAKQGDFLAVLSSFLKKLPTDHKFAIEIRNRTWFNAVFADRLREHKIALVLQDLSFMPVRGNTRSRLIL
jgi:uncharacterized protein YecE (DUF72 family)